MLTDVGLDTGADLRRQEVTDYDGRTSSIRASPSRVWRLRQESAGQYRSPSHRPCLDQGDRFSGLGHPERGACYRTTVHVSDQDVDLFSDSYQLFERCAKVLSTMSRVIARGANS